MNQDRQNRKEPERADRGGLPSIAELSEDLKAHQAELERRNRELHETQVILDRSRERYFALFDLSPVAYFVIDRAHRIQEVNSAAATLLGFARHEVRGQAFHRFLHAEAWPLFSAHLEDAMVQQGRRVVDMHLQCGDGRLLPVHLQSQWMQGADDSQELCLVSCVDLSQIRNAETAIRQSEERYRQLVEWIPDAVLVLMGGCVEYANPAGQMMIGGAAGTDLTGVLWSRIMRGKETVLPELTATSPGTTPTPSAAREIQFHRLDGNSFHAEAAFVPIEFRQQLAVLVILRDVTERRQAEQARWVMERRMQEALRLESLGVIAAGVAHDFNNQLTDLMGSVALARRAIEIRGNPTPPLLRAEAAAARIAEVCRKLVTAAGISRTQREWIDLDLVVAECIPLLQLSLHSHVQLDWAALPEPRRIKGDAGQIRQLILNVVQNAVEAIGDQPGSIRIMIEEVSMEPGAHSVPTLPSGIYTGLKISDTGAGIAPDILTRVFDPFFSTKFIGRGLGLSAVLGIMRNHAGGITVDSRLSLGTTFTFLFPRDPELARPARLPQRKALEDRGDSLSLPE